MKTIRLIGRGSRLSLLQLEKVKQKIEVAYPGIDVQIIARNSRGDALQDLPLHTVEGSDFFTQDIFDALSSNEADIAVHSLKDMSSEHFFGAHQFAVVDRDDTHDVAIFQKDIEKKIAAGQTLIIGTCSPRREEMAIGFLKKALPQLYSGFSIETKHIRGNVDTRLRKLDNGEYDGIILATAGLNRLLNSGEDASAIKELLKDKKLMVLPLIECVPAPCQGAIVAEAHPANRGAVSILRTINDAELMNACIEEKRTAKQYGIGCLQRFGVTSIRYGNKQIFYAAGKDSNGESFSNWTGLPEIKGNGKTIFSTTDTMGGFFSYQYVSEIPYIRESIAYIANYKAAEQQEIIAQLKTKRIWVAGTKTWLELAKKGLWVEGSADAFGLEFLQSPWQMPLIGISKKETAIVTNKQSAAIWQSKGWTTYGTYATTEKYSPEIETKIRQADIIFWTSYRQYEQYRNVIKEDALHVCPHGETAEQFKTAGLQPLVFPNIKAFQQWKQTFGH